MRIPRRSDRALGALLLAASGALAAPISACAQGSAGALRVVAEPPRLVLGRDPAAELRVTAPFDLGDVSITSSIGRVEGLRRLPGGGWAARFQPPRERVPAVAIVTALGSGPRGTEHGFVAIPLSGQGDARVRGAPGSAVTLRIGDRTFGPQLVGKDGVAVIPIVVPPGIREAHRGFKPIDLNVPDTPLLHAVIDRTTVRADREEQVRAFACVVAPHGAPRRGDVPAVEPSRGTVAVVERDAGAFDVTWTLPPGRAGEERLSIRLAAAPASRTVLKVEAVAGPPAVVAVAFDRDALVAGAAEPVRVVARALDAGGNQVPAEIVLSAEGGSLSDPAERSPGEVEARVGAGPAFGGRREVVVTARAPGVGVSGARALRLRSGEPAVARFDRDGSVLRADGERRAELRVRIEDRFGNPVEHAPRVSAERGRVVAVATDGPGAYVVRYVGPAVREATDERLVAEIGALRARTDRLLVPPDRPESPAAGAGVALDLGGRFAVPVLTISAERPADVAFTLRRGYDVALRGEVGAVGFASGAGLSLLAGASAARVARGLDLRAFATAGVLAGRGASPALRLGVRLGAPSKGSAPFVEAAFLAAGSGAPGAFAAFMLAGGMRFAWRSERWPRS